jgi:alpha-ribazole phosphatase
LEIHFIRHGKTIANEKKLYCGQTDLPLSDNGAADLAALKEQGIYPKCSELCFTSGLLRTEQTLDLLYGSVHRDALSQLAEYHFGEFEMKSYEELKGRSNYQSWVTDETGVVACPGGECKQQFTSRVLEGLEVIEETAKHEKDLIVICHGGTIACVMEHLYPKIRSFYEWQPKPGRGYTLTYSIFGFGYYKPI